MTAPRPLQDADTKDVPMPGLFGGAYAGSKVLITGDTGFKGSWLAAWLLRLGASVSGFSLPPQEGEDRRLFELLELDRRIERMDGDLRDAEAVSRWVKHSAPDVVFHLAAQPLVRRGYREPLLTLSTNVLGTAHLLEACRQVPTLRAAVVVTTDKVYEENPATRGYVEHDRLGGHDPYSASKAAAELVVSSYRSSFLAAAGVRVATARAGNVFGGGDFCEDRLLPDCVRALAAGEPVQLRNPRAVRPWQHVLEALASYLHLGAGLLGPGGASLASAWNFGPEPDDAWPVEQMTQAFLGAWGQGSLRITEDTLGPHEAPVLRLDTRRAREELGLAPVWRLSQGLVHTARWYRTHAGQGADAARLELHRQLETFEHDARQAGAIWTRGAQP